MWPGSWEGRGCAGWVVGGWSRECLTVMPESETPCVAVPLGMVALWGMVVLGVPCAAVRLGWSSVDGGQCPDGDLLGMVVSAGMVDCRMVAQCGMVVSRGVPGVALRIHRRSSGKGTVRQGTVRQGTIRH
jgi:hypothetical protein